jgi:hypothetical protein
MTIERIKGISLIGFNGTHRHLGTVRLADLQHVDSRLRQGAVVCTRSVCSEPAPEALLTRGAVGAGAEAMAPRQGP